MTVENLVQEMVESRENLMVVESDLMMALMMVVKLVFATVSRKVAKLADCLESQWAESLEDLMVDTMANVLAKK